MPKTDFRDPSNAATVVIDADKADLTAGGSGQDGTVHIRTKDGKETITIGAGGSGGQILIATPDGKQVLFVASTGDFALGGNGHSGDVTLFPPNSLAGGAAVLAGQAQKPTVLFRASTASATVGGNGLDGILQILNKDNKAVIRLVGASGDIEFENADVAEDFDVADPSEAEPGALMVFNNDGKLVQSELPYDRRVAGVIAGAGLYRPSIVLDRQRDGRGRAAVTVMGKAYCRADALGGAIGVGDLLTTSAVRGHAMKATSVRRAFGAVIGKALKPLREGRGIIPVLVGLR